MDLLVAVIQRAAVVDVRWPAADVRVGQSPGRHSRWTTGADRLDERAVIRRNAPPEVGRYRAGIRVLLHRDARIPSLEAIHISRLFGAARVETTWLAPVFDIDAEHKPAQRLVLATVTTRGRLEYSQTREDDRIRWGRTRFRSADLMIRRVAQAVVGRRTDEDSTGAATEASALE